MGVIYIYCSLIEAIKSIFLFLYIYVVVKREFGALTNNLEVLSSMFTFWAYLFVPFFSSAWDHVLDLSPLSIKPQEVTTFLILGEGSRHQIVYFLCQSCRQYIQISRWIGLLLGKFHLWWEYHTLVGNRRKTKTALIRTDNKDDVWFWVVRHHGSKDIVGEREHTDTSTWIEKNKVFS